MQIEGIKFDADQPAVTVPEPITAIPERAFEGNRRIKVVRLPKTLRAIEDSAFRNCDELMSIEVPEGVTRIGKFAFANCRSLEHLVLPSTLTKIDDGAFHNCKILRRLTLNPGGRFVLTNGIIYDTVADEVISGTGGIKHPKIPATTKGIRDYAFDSGIISVTMRRVPDYIGAHSFPNDTMQGFLIGDDTEPQPLLFNADGTKLIRCCVRQGEVFIPKGVRSIATGAFYGCKFLSGISFPASLLDCPDTLFDELTFLKAIFIEKGMGCDLPCSLVDFMDERLPPEMRYGTFRRKSMNVFERCETPDDGQNPETQSAGAEQPDDSLEFDNTDFKRQKANKKKRREPSQPPRGFSRRPKREERKDDKEKMEEKVPESRFKPVDVSGTTLDMVAGLEKAKKVIRDRIILSAEHPEIFETYHMKPATGILLYGPPGTGKTFLARAIACELKADFFSIRPSDINARFVGESEGYVRELFEEAAKSERAVIFFDDFDSLGAIRGNERTPWRDDLVNELLTQIQGLEGRNGSIYLLAATNRPWAIDTALMRSGRFSVHIHVPLPDAGARMKILMNALDGVPLADPDLDSIVRMTEGYNGADITEVAEAAKLSRIVAVAAGGKEGVTTEDLVSAIAQVPSTVSRKDIEDIEHYERTGTAPPSFDREETYAFGPHKTGDPSYG